MWKYLITLMQIAFKYRSVVKEVKDVYERYRIAKQDGRITVKEMRSLTDEVFDVIAVLIPAVKELKRKP